ncbi:MAG: ABC transporter permease subunit [Synergistaceae bacterium]|jgi:putative spermidine/putrescine transport system permease protein|nr:ABC transporter permease subunit [Synergistaceae bacterium]
MLRRAFSVSLMLLYFSFILAPIFLMLIGSFGEKWFGTLLPTGFTLEWYAQLFRKAMYVRAMVMSLWIAALTVLINGAISILTVYAVHVLESRRIRAAFDFCLLLPIAIPPVVMGLGMIQAYNWKGFSLVGTWQLLLGAHIAYTLPFMMRPLMANIEMIRWSALEEMCVSLGASLWTTIRRVLIPNLLPGVVSGALMTFAMSLGEFQLAVMVTGSRSQTFPVVLYQAFYVSTGFACAATTLLILTSLLSLVGLVLVGRSFSGEIVGG